MHHCGGWEAVRERVRQEIGPRAFAAWFAGLDAGVEAQRLVIRCPDRFVRDWVEGLYGEALRRAASAYEAIEYRVEGKRSLRASRPAGRVERGREPEPPPQRTTLCENFESFVAGPTNALALEAARAVARDEAGRCNPLVLAGPSGLGKTHLCTAIRAEVGSAVYRSSEEFTAEVTQAIRQDRMAGVRQRYRRSANLLILEDLQFLAGKRATQSELFHTVNHLLARGKQVVITAQCPPREIEGVDRELAARLTSGLVARIGPPERETRRRILHAKASAGGVRLSEASLELLAEREVESVSDLLAGLNQVVARATLLKRPIAPELVREALAAVEVPGRRRTLREIIEMVARSYGLELEELRGPTRKRRVARPRQLAMYLCRRYTDASLKEIGRALARDHSSVLYAVAAVERRLLEQPQLRYQLEALANRLR